MKVMFLMPFWLGSFWLKAMENHLLKRGLETFQKSNHYQEDQTLVLALSVFPSTHPSPALLPCLCLSLQIACSTLFFLSLYSMSFSLPHSFYLLLVSVVSCHWFAEALVSFSSLVSFQLQFLLLRSLFPCSDSRWMGLSGSTNLFCGISKLPVLFIFPFSIFWPEENIGWGQIP